MSVMRGGIEEMMVETICVWEYEWNEVKSVISRDCEVLGWIEVWNWNV